MRRRDHSESCRARPPVVPVTTPAVVGARRRPLRLSVYLPAGNSRTSRALSTLMTWSAEAHVERFAIIAIGASAGGVNALQAIAADLPPGLPAAILIVQHVGVRSSFLPELLARAGPLPAAHTRHHEPICPGRI